MNQSSENNVAPKADWNSGVKLQLMHFRSLAFREKLKIVEDMELLALFLLDKKKKRISSIRRKSIKVDSQNDEN